jgi:hypothetical protein
MQNRGNVCVSLASASLSKYTYGYYAKATAAYPIEFFLFNAKVMYTSTVFRLLKFFH